MKRYIYNGAARGGHLDVLKWARASIGDHWWDTMFFATSKKQWQIVKWALDNGCDTSLFNYFMINIAQSKRWDLYTLAASKGIPSSVDHYVEYMSFSKLTRDYGHILRTRAFFHAAAMFGRMEVLEYYDAHAPVPRSWLNKTFFAQTGSTLVCYVCL